MITPSALAGPQYYKAGDYVTFAWNYTGVSATPSNIDVLVSCSDGSRTFTVAANQTVEPTGSFTWDTNQYPKNEFAIASYTLIVMDAQLDISASPRPGYLGVANQFTFGMYTPQAYTPLNGKHLAHLPQRCLE